MGTACRASEQSPAPVAADRQESLWYERSRVVDVTGDGLADTLWLRGHGARGDSLQVAFTVSSAGREVLRESWQSEYMLIDPPFDLPATQPVIDSYIRAQLDTTLADVSLVPVTELDFREQWPPTYPECGGDPRDCIAYVFRYEAAGVDWRVLPPDSAGLVRAPIENAPFDTARVNAIADDIRQTGYVLSLVFGYEGTELYGWSQRERRFFLVYDCC